jgi:hypothetical protein
VIYDTDEKTLLGLKMLMHFTPSTGKHRKSAKEAIEDVIVTQVRLHFT